MEHGGSFGRSDSMKLRVKDPRKRIVSERLRLFFAALKDQLARNTEDLWKRVESKLMGTASDRQHSDNRKT